MLERHALWRVRRHVVPCATRPVINAVPGRVRMTTTNAAAKAGDWVQVHYTGTLDDLSIFDTSRKRGTTLDFVIGQGKVIKGFDTAVLGLEVGQSRKSRIAPEDAYGLVDPDLTIRFPAKDAPKGLEVNMKVKLSNGMIAKCTKLDDNEVELDLNHELAGKALTFDVELVGLVPQEQTDTITLGMGCFWGPELMFQRVPGVLSTQTGSAQGTVDSPTYEQVCSGGTGAVEVVQLMYDTQAVTLEQLLDIFWKQHDPTTLNRQGSDQGTQYRSGIYCHTAEQCEAAMASKAAAQARFGSPIVTEIAALDKYSSAEAYHQQYLARGGRFGKPQNPAKNCSDPIRCYG